MVFLQPTILIDSDDVSTLSGQKYNYINAEAIFRSSGDVELIDLTD
jgi:hypothetical protein